MLAPFTAVSSAVPANASPSPVLVPLLANAFTSKLAPFVAEMVPPSATRDASPPYALAAAPPDDACPFAAKAMSPATVSVPSTRTRVWPPRAVPAPSTSPAPLAAPANRATLPAVALKLPPAMSRIALPPVARPPSPIPVPALPPVAEALRMVPIALLLTICCPAPVIRRSTVPPVPLPP